MGKAEREAKMIMGKMKTTLLFNINSIKQDDVRLLVRDLLIKDEWRDTGNSIYQRCGVLSATEKIFIEEINGKFYLHKCIDRVTSWLDINRRGIGDSWIESEIIKMENEYSSYKTAMIAMGVIQMKKNK